MSIIQKYEKIVILAKSKLHSMDVLISKALIDSYIIHDEFISINNVLENVLKLKKKS